MKIETLLLSWFSLIALAMLPARAADNEVTVDLCNRSEPVSPYVYSQFIEHLGRCIYGGIWAEMLEDRKFYYPVTPEYAPYMELDEAPEGEESFPIVVASPWEIVGDGNSVIMVEEDSFVGEHTPLVAGGGAIRQNDLGVVKGKKYTGYIWLKAADRGCEVVVRLSASGASCVIGSVGTSYTKYPFEFTAEETTDEASLTISIGNCECSIGTVSLMPADNVKGMRTDTLKLLRELNSPMYRWPGGNFVSAYDWRDGIGDRDRRPPRKSPAWKGLEHNDFGLDEFMVFCREINTEPLVVVNTGFGDPYSAAQEVEYCNGGPDTIGGICRIQNGHAEPYNVVWWGIGNEMYGKWQMGYMPLNQYTIKHNLTVEYMKRVDPFIRTVAVGGGGDWSKIMLEQCAENMDVISLHAYARVRPGYGLWEKLHYLGNKVAGKIAKYRGERKVDPVAEALDIDLSIDEWAYWYGPQLFGEVGTRYYYQDALGTAICLHEFFRNSDMVAMAHYAQAVNVLGCIKTSRTAAEFATPGLPLKLYRAEYGTIPVEVSGAPESLDVAAALTGDESAVTVAVVNTTTEPVSFKIGFSGGAVSESAGKWVIACDDLMAYNTPGKPRKVDIVKSTVPENSGSLHIAPISIALWRFPVSALSP